VFIKKLIIILKLKNKFCIFINWKICFNINVFQRFFAADLRNYFSITSALIAIIFCWINWAERGLEIQIEFSRQFSLKDARKIHQNLISSSAIIQLNNCSKQIIIIIELEKSRELINMQIAYHLAAKKESIDCLFL
jgi:hypothetical protein